MPFEQENGECQITVYPKRKLGTVDPMIFGHFTEHAFRCIYEGLYDPQSEFADEADLRKDVVNAIKDVKPAVIRYPGGNFASAYHWEDGVGPKDQRKRLFEFAWKAEESNRFGTVEFIEFCRKVNAQPHICVNMGSGTAEEAMHWVEYCNGTGDTYYANLRQEHGYAEPFGVKYWGLGNEMMADWQFGYLNAKDYARKALHFATAMRSVDPDIILVADGFGGTDWDLEIIKVLAEHIDYISYHHYSAIGDRCFDMDDYLQLMAISESIDKDLNLVRSVIEAVCGNVDSPIKIAADEWNMISWDFDKREENSEYTLINALVTASTLNTFIRNCNIVGMANYSPFINITGAVYTHDKGIVLRPQYYAFKLLSNNTGTALVDSFVECEQFEVTFPMQKPVKHCTAEIKYIDVVSTLDEKGNKLYLSIVNKHPEKVVSTSIQVRDVDLKPKAKVLRIYNENKDAFNSVDSPDRIGIQEESFEIKDDSHFTISIPQHSANVIVLELK